MKEIYEFLMANPVFALATMDGDKPRVRNLMLHKADESGIYFMVGKLKDVYRQISVNPHVELCFHAEKMQVRITGIAENLDHDLEIKKEILEARPYLRSWIEAKGLKYMAVFRVTGGKAAIWTLEDEFKPPVIIQL